FPTVRRRRGLWIVRHEEPPRLELRVRRRRALRWLQRRARGEQVLQGRRWHRPGLRDRLPDQQGRGRVQALRDEDEGPLCQGGEGVLSKHLRQGQERARLRVREDDEVRL